MATSSRDIQTNGTEAGQRELKRAQGEENSAHEGQPGNQAAQGQAVGDTGDNVVAEQEPGQAGGRAGGKYCSAEGRRPYGRATEQQTVAVQESTGILSLL